MAHIKHFDNQIDSYQLTNHFKFYGSIKNYLYLTYKRNYLLKVFP